ncbi:MAG: hypothetical protein AUK64_2693, partial [bacterium P201]
MPCPATEAEGFAFNPVPADDEDEIEPASVTLRWMVPEYATGWRLVFGSTYYPDPNHPQTIIYPEDGGFSTDMANSYTVRNLWNNTNYFWHVEFNNTACPEGVSSPIWGFTTHLNVPQNLTAVDETVFDDEQIVLNWTAVVDRTYRFYNVYRDGELIGNTQVNNISNTTFTDGPLEYNMEGYTYYVTAVYDEGESAPSNTVNVKVSGYGDVNGHVYEQDGTTGIAGATALHAVGAFIRVGGGHSPRIGGIHLPIEHAEVASLEVFDDFATRQTAAPVHLDVRAVRIQAVGIVLGDDLADGIEVLIEDVVDRAGGFVVDDHDGFTLDRLVGGLVTVLGGLAVVSSTSIDVAG